jgi:Tol biopolymer transport system component
MNESGRLGLVVCASMIVALWLPMGGCEGEQQDGASKNGGRATETTVAGETSQRTDTSMAFESDRDGNAEVYIMNPDGSDQKRLSNSPAADVGPAFSPDGNNVAFASDRDGDAEIYVMDADGSNQQMLTHNSATDTEPVFSPDGSMVAFASDRDGNFEVYVMDADGTNQTNLTNDAASSARAAFSPDGQKIVFESFRDGNAEVYIMNPDGTGQTRLTNNPAYDGQPVFLLDDSKIAFVSDRDGDAEIYVMDADGSNQQMLTHNSATDAYPVAAFLSDGGKVAFASDRDGNPEVYVMDADGSNQKRLTSNPATDSTPTFPSGGRKAESAAAGTTDVAPRNATAKSHTLRSAVIEVSNSILVTDALGYYPPEHRRLFALSPGGDKVAFASEPEGYGGLYAVGADGSDPIELVDGTMTESQPAYLSPEEPAFSPDGDKIAFARYVHERRPSGISDQVDLYTVKPDGTGLTNVTDSNSVNEHRPTFSPKRDQIAFERDTHDKGSEIYVMDPDGTNQTDLTNSTANDTLPAFSPDGGKIAFASNRDGMSNFEVYVMDADGSNQRRLTNDAAWDDHPTFSSDGKKVAFTRKDLMSPDDAEIYVVNVDGTGLIRLTHKPAYDGQPAFVPGTDLVAFVSDRDGDEDIYAVNSDGAGLMNLTNTDSANEGAPAFSSDGTKMAYASIRRDRSSKLVEEIYVMDLHDKLANLNE